MKLEGQGFKIDGKYLREDILNSVLPITLNFDTKGIGRMGNVTCAVVALSQGMIIKEKDFWKQLDDEYLYKKWSNALFV